MILSPKLGLTVLLQWFGQFISMVSISDKKRIDKLDS